MKKINLVGIGMGNPDTLTQEGIRAIENAQVFIGARRMLEAVSCGGREIFESYDPLEIKQFIETSVYERYTILFSGDTGFYSGAGKVTEALREKGEYEVKVIPGISTVSYFSALLGISWEDACILSLHGKSSDFTRAVRGHSKTFLLTDGRLSVIGKELMAAGLLELDIYAGTALSYAEEEVIKVTPAELAVMEDKPLTSLFIINNFYQKEYHLGIPDEEFIRGDIPMTKSEVRLLSISKLSLKDNDILYDIGAGTGSLSVEAALLLNNGWVYAVEEKEEGAELIERNRDKFSLKNLTVIKGSAPDCLEELPVPDAAFIGGSRGKLSNILEELLQRNPSIRLVLNAITLETLSEALEAFRKLEITDMEILQAAITKTRTAGPYHMLSAQNPVFIIKGRGKGNT
jgi:precorrin-6B C5,15-methyltransferase / cobalt-precorrin-6B C5,C15-methyltransferase